MIQNIGRHTVRVFGRTVMDGGMLWLLSSLSGIGFRITGARRLEIVLESDDTTADPARMHLTPRFAVLVDGDTVIDRCMKEREETVAVFESGNPWGAEIRKASPLRRRTPGSPTRALLRTGWGWIPC